MNDQDQKLRTFILEASQLTNALFFQLRERLDIHALPPDVKLALRDLEGWSLKAKAVSGGMDPCVEYDLTSFRRTFSPKLRALQLQDGEDPTAPRVAIVDGAMIVEIP